VRRFRCQYRWWQGWAQTGGECVRNEAEEQFGRAGVGLVAGIAGLRGRVEQAAVFSWDLKKSRFVLWGLPASDCLESS